jgi:hypothetical protein
MKTITTIIAAAACALTLTACGGGGGDDIVASTTTATGNTSGTDSNGGTGSSTGSTGTNGSGSSSSDSSGTSGTTNDTGTGSNTGRTSNSNSGSGGNILSRADEGIWNFIYSGPLTNLGWDQMQTVILSDGSYWSVYGLNMENNTAFAVPFYVEGLAHGTASINGNSVSGTYFDTVSSLTGYTDGSYSGTVSAQQNLDITFSDSTLEYRNYGILNPSISMSYDSIYNQPASLTDIAGTYSGVGFVASTASIDYTDFSSIATNNLVISGSSLTFGTGPCAMNGNIQPHGAGTVNIFDINFTTSCQTIYFGTAGLLQAGTAFQGILFRTSGNTKNYIEIVATTDDPSHNYFFMGSK